MSTYLIGDIHGCYNELMTLLNYVNFNPNNDVLWLTGDLVEKGPDSLSVLRYVKSINKNIRLVLGNHDLNLLASYSGIFHKKPKISLNTILKAKDIDEIIYWLRCQPLLQIDEEKKIIMVHAGITPQWDLNTAKTCAKEIENILSSDNYKLFLNSMYGDMPNDWNENLTDSSRLRFSVNVLTRMRYCFNNGRLANFYEKKLDSGISKILKPWFNFKSQIHSEYTIIFGHWSALQGRGTPKNVIGLDTGCCWGGSLTLLDWEKNKYYQVNNKTIKKNIITYYRNM
ncbi:MAG: bis(5'-nucleosyl)-tetraphosphatase (symmetrical) [Pantoea sp. Brub]|nr:bis(5'-nucleosyl)-tetraphosphatase (symmetrical) [Pantoea sp. Brub]